MLGGDRQWSTQVAKDRQQVGKDRHNMTRTKKKKQASKQTKTESDFPRGSTYYFALIWF